MKLAKTSKAKPKVVRKNNGALIIKDWVSDSEEEDVLQAKIEKKTVKPNFAKIEFVKSKENMVPKAVLMRFGLVSLTAARPVNTAQPRTTMNSARSMTNVFNKAHSTVRRPINNKRATKNSNFNQKVNTARPKAVLNPVKGNQVNDVKGTCPILLTLNKLMEDMLPLEETPKEGKSQEKVESKLVQKHVMMKSSPDAGFKPSGDDEKKVTKEPRKEGGDSSKDGESYDQENEDNVNSTNTVNATSINEVNVVGVKTSIKLLDDPNMPELEDIVYLDDDEDVGAEADMNNLDAFMPVSPIPTTRIHKDHPVEQIIGDLNSAP
ncbi:hypothetical protein Tco_0933154 [Tanacetum coccineum]